MDSMLCAGTMCGAAKAMPVASAWYGQSARKLRLILTEPSSIGSYGPMRSLRHA